MFKRRSTKYYIFLLWIFLAAICWIYPYFIHRGNNYKIFIGVYNHLISSSNLYVAYPNEYYDTNHYGPLFSLIIAPFAVLPYFFGGLLWNIFNSVILLFAIYKLPIARNKKNAISLLSAISFAQSQADMQSNAFTASLIILSFVFILERKEALAVLLIIAGTLIKLYPIVGLSFFLFSANKRRFVIWFLIWGVVLTVLPALFSSLDFVFGSYKAWFQSLCDKNQLNILSSSQNYSIMGLVNKIFRSQIGNIPFLIFGAIIAGLNLLSFRKSSLDNAVNNINSMTYKLYILSSLLLMVVLFSTSSESTTYIIAIIGCFLWLMMQEKPFQGFNLYLTLVILVISIAPTDLFPMKARDLLLTDWVIMTWPCIIIWLKISWDINIKWLDFAEK